MKATTSNVKRSLGLVSGAEHVRAELRGEITQRACDAGVHIWTERDFPGVVYMGLTTSLRQHVSEAAYDSVLDGWVEQLRAAGWSVRRTGGLILINEGEAA